MEAGKARLSGNTKRQASSNEVDDLRQLAWQITDEQGYFISESSVYRILRSYDLSTSPAYAVIKASDKFKNPTKRVNELWQTDFTQFNVFGWGWYYLCTVLDDFSRYIIAWPRPWPPPMCRKP
jgi:putative transposase